MTNSSAPHLAHPFNLTSRIVDLGLELARQDARRAASMMAAAGIPFRVIIRVLSEPTLCGRRDRCSG
jgi:hypothetical protein